MKRIMYIEKLKGYGHPSIYMSVDNLFMKSLELLVFVPVALWTELLPI